MGFVICFKGAENGRYAGKTLHGRIFPTREAAAFVLDQLKADDPGIEYWIEEKEDDDKPLPYHGEGGG